MRLTVRVSPGASATRVGGRHGEAEPPVLVVKVAARAVDGKANDAVVGALATAFGVVRRDVRIVRGHTSRTKVVDVDGASTDTLATLLTL